MAKLLTWGALLFGVSAIYGQTPVLTWHNDNARTGQYLSETTLTPLNVNSSTFGKLFVISVDGKVDAQPLYVPSVPVSGQGVHNVLYVETEHDSAYAFDADTGTQLWKVSLALSGETSSDDRGCSQVTPEIGITATPVIDLASGTHGTIYMIAMSKDSGGNYHHRLHALDITSGAEEFSGPMEVSGTFPGSGAENTFLPSQHKERPGLLLLNGVVYTTWGSHCDAGPYTGWVFGYNETTLAKVSTMNLTPNGNDGGIWNAGSGPAADGSGNIFLLTGNGTFDTTLTPQNFPSKGDYGNAFVKMSTANSTLTVLDYFTMDNTTNESNGDVDLGSGGLMLLPLLPSKNGGSVSLAVGAGKDTNLYVVDQGNLGKFSSSADSIYQQISGALPGGIWSSPAWFNGTLYYGSVSSTLRAFTYSNTTGLFGTGPSSQSPTSFGYPGTTPSISANGTSNAIVWAAENSSPATLHAYDATNLGSELYNSNQATGSRDQFGTGNKYIVPTVANGKVYVGTTNGVGVFGLLVTPAAPVLTAPANGATGVSATPTLSWSAATGATSYDVYFGTASSPPMVTTVSGTTYSPSTLAFNTHYFWKIVAKNSVGSTASAIWSFTTVVAPPPAPVLTAPANASTGQSLSAGLTWQSAAGATSYDVHFGTTTPPPLVTNVAGTTYSPGTLAAGTLYYWEIVAKNAGGSTASAIWTFTTLVAAPPAPVLTSPANGATGQSLTLALSWQSATGATSYDVHFGTTTPPPLATNIAGTSYSPGTLAAGTLYYWEIVAKNAGGSTPSAIWSFTTGVAAPPAPVLTSPANGSTGQSTSAALSWQAASGATSYDVHFGTTTPPPLVTNVTGTSYSPAGMASGVLYYWQIVAKNGTGSASSAIWTFTTLVGAPSAPVLTSPANSSTGQSTSAALSWQAASGATSYDVHFGTTTPPPLVTNVTGTSYSPAGMASGVLYYWQIVAKDNTGSASSAIWTFTTGVTPPASSTSPGSGSGLNQNFTFTFTDVSGWQHLSVLNILINSSLDGRHGCYLAVVPSTATSASVFLVDDAGDTAGPYSGMVLPGAGTVANSQCSISGSGSSISASGNSLTLTLAATFSSGFAGNQVIYVAADDHTLGSSGWQAQGTWNVPGAAPTGPAVSGMSPARSSGLNQIYTFTFTDTNGWQDIAVADILINNGISGVRGCYVAVVPTGASAGSLYLVDDAGDSGGPYAGMTLPGSGTVANSQCSISGLGSSVMGSGNTLTVTLAMTFTEAFSGNQVFYIASRSNTISSNWQAVGSVDVP